MQVLVCYFGPFLHQKTAKNAVLSLLKCLGETDIETAVRETKEETGLDVEIIDTDPIKTGHLRRGGAIYKEILLFKYRCSIGHFIPLYMI